MQRRSVLASIGVGIAAGSAGCVDNVADMIDSSSRIGWIGVDNYDDEPHQFEVQVERDGSTVHESSHGIPGKDDYILSGEVLECTWGDTEGTYSIRSRIDGGEWVERSVDDSIGGAVECVTARVSYGDLGDTLDIFIRENCDDVPTYDGGCAFANE